MERFGLSKIKRVEPFNWELLNESGMKVIMRIMDDEEQGPTKEWELFGW